MRLSQKFQVAIDPEGRRRGPGVRPGGGEGADPGGPGGRGQRSGGAGGPPGGGGVYDFRVEIGGSSLKLIGIYKSLLIMAS